MQTETLEKAIKESWDKQTCYPDWANKWTPDNPSLGQCAVTALVIQDYLEGELLYCEHENHYWNRLPNKKEIDFTRDQFPKGTDLCLDEIRSREDILPTIHQRYNLLKERVKHKLKT